MPGKKWTDETTKMAIIADKASGLPLKVISERYQIDPATVWRICKRVQQAHPNSAIARGTASGDLRTRINSKAVIALEDGWTVIRTHTKEEFWACRP